MSVSLISREKWEKLKALSDAIVRARQMLAEHPNHYNATDLQLLEQQRSDLRATVGFMVIQGGLT